MLRHHREQRFDVERLVLDAGGAGFHFAGVPGSQLIAPTRKLLVQGRERGAEQGEIDDVPVIDLFRLDQGQVVTQLRQIPVDGTGGCELGPVHLNEAPKSSAGRLRPSCIGKRCVETSVKPCQQLCGQQGGPRAGIERSSP